MRDTAFDVDQVKRSSSSPVTMASQYSVILIGNQIRQDLRMWLFPPDPSTNHNTARKTYLEGTATWFFRGGLFKEWKSGPSLLWIHGKRTSPVPLPTHTLRNLVFLAGSGKSVLWSVVSLLLSYRSTETTTSSGIIENIMPLREAGSVSLAYFYCDFRDDHKQSCSNLLLSIVTQLAAQSNLCCDILSRLYSAHDDGSRRPSDGALTQSLKEMLSLPTQGPVYLIVDALDECPNNSGMPTSREEVLDLVQDLIGLYLPNLHICHKSPRDRHTNHP